MRRAVAEAVLVAGLVTLGGSARAASTEPDGPAARASVPDERFKLDPPETLPLDEALRRASEHNAPLAQMEARADEAWGVARQAAAAVLPVVAATGSYLRNSDEATLSIKELFGGLEDALTQVTGFPVELDDSGLPEDTVIQPLESFTGTLSARVPLFAANAYADLAAARSAARAAGAGVEAARAQVEAAVVQAAWLSSAAEGFADVAARAVANAEKHRETVARAAESGTQARLAVLQAEADVFRRRADAAEAAAAVDRVWRTLGALLGEDRPVRIALPEGRGAIAGDVEQWVEEAQDRRAEVQAQRAALQAARHALTSAWMRGLPTVSGAFGWSASTVPFITGEDTAWRLSLDLQWVLFDGGFRYGKGRQARAQVRGAEAGLRDQRLQVAQQVRDAARDLSVAAERMALADEQVRLAREAAETARRGFAQGLVPSLDVLDASDRVVQAEVSQADARARIGRARAALLRARGLPAVD